MGFTIDSKDIHQGFKNASWPCRFELINKKPLIIVDSAHNGDSAQKLSSTVRDYLKNSDVTLIFGASEDKDIKAMFSSLLPISDVIIMTKSIHPRAAEPKQLQDIAREMGRESHSTESIEKAIDFAMGVKKDNVILVTGSIFVAAAAKEIIQKLNQDKP
jgi:dihydrofolate synthase/folylpolyglutamate synthase